MRQSGEAKPSSTVSVAVVAGKGSSKPHGIVIDLDGERCLVPWAVLNGHTRSVALDLLRWAGVTRNPPPTLPVEPSQPTLWH